VSGSKPMNLTHEPFRLSLSLSLSRLDRVHLICMSRERKLERSADSQQAVDLARALPVLKDSKGENKRITSSVASQSTLSNHN
jgi:hypothetical protein